MHFRGFGSRIDPLLCGLCGNIITDHGSLVRQVFVIDNFYLRPRPLDCIIRSSRRRKKRSHDGLISSVSQSVKTAV